MEERVISIRKVRNPTISIIIPTLNEEKYIPFTLISLRNQNFRKKYEIIVSDSNSKDRTIEIAKKYADKIIVTKRMGVSVGRNLGAKHSKGKILLFVDADTILLPNVLERVYKAMKEKDVVGCNVPLLLDDLKRNFYFSFHIPIYYLLTQIKLNPTYSVVFACKRDAFFKVGGFNEKLRVAEDIELGQRLKKIGRIAYLTDTFAISSARRYKKWGAWRTFYHWLGSYFYIKLLNKQLPYPPIR